MENFQLARDDAQKSLDLSPKYEKAHFRLVKSLIMLSNFKQARLQLLAAIKECGSTKDLKALELEIFNKTAIPVRPNPNDFEVINELGDGNFSKIYQTKYKSNGKVFAMKVIEKNTVQRMKRRHGNIENEIMMEKAVLHKLDHPSIVILYATMQDFGTLYYQMEFLEGGQLWDLAADSFNGMSCMVGCPLSMSVLYLAEILNALEYMHR